ncbi:hydrolase, NUDIX family domain protein [Burkholderia pseudomallei MSHR5855]|nr:hydrolase, NUDIX family domain protein [Burkholderia pseudomallei MSHR5855]AIP42624.1 hydrolase, NUDIX family domain protein [Burkholderia pseudomallei MSHR5848]
MRRAPLPAYRSLSAIPFACRFRLPLLTPGPLPLAPSPFYSLPFTFTLRPRPVSRFQPSAGSSPFGQRRAPARARRPGATPPVPDMMRAGRAHSAHSRIRARRAPSECRAITRANMEEFAMRCSPTAPARNRSCQARTRDVRPGRRLRVPRDRAHARLCTRRHAVAQETHPKGSPMHESKSFDAGLARRGDHGDNTLGPPGKRRGVDTPPPRSAPPPKASRLPPTARHDVAGMRVAHRPPPNPTRTPARPSAPRRECAPARTNRSVLHRCAPRFADAAAARAAPGRARVNRRAWDALAPRSRRRLRHRHCRRPCPAARARRSSRAASAPAARAPDRRAQAA